MILFYRLSGLAALGTGLVGIFVPLLPTIPFILLAAFCFARSHPLWEARLLRSRFGPAIIDWRETGAISRKGKVAVLSVFGLSGTAGYLSLEGWRALLPVLACAVGAIWILTRPTAVSRPPSD
ncbi:YbaN family protein [Sphingosinicella rhizophila]|uniref:YbaN family protein n=1 Tax=Sphingosinicella rhizophila TaxID=3050082 RepID=A0ABU3QBP7_9SPHN|nr:YbaN family protein [Sphingosinicella sp. GR2756]MDT9600574.1 YbaN family protein [Sphingosinicella sp. GR2756]